MAASAPSRIVISTHDEHEGDRFIENLNPWRTRLWIQQILRWSEYAFISGMLCACLILLISRFIPWPAALYWAFGAVIGITLCAFVATIWYRPSYERTARYVDTRLALHDRISTALELREDSTPISVLQRRDALRELRKYKSAATLSLLPGRAAVLTIGIATLALAALILLPNPMNTYLQQQAALQARLNRQIAAINRTRLAIDNQQAMSPQERALIDTILRNLLAQLQKSTSQEQAQQSISQAQSQLNQLRDQQASQKAQGRANASDSLQTSSNTNLSNTGKALASGDSKALKSSLQNLASQVAHMTLAQRAQLSQQIERAASQGQNNPQLSAALHQLAKSVSDNNSNEISDAMTNLESAISQDNANSAINNNINQASQSLQSAANALASATDSSPNQNSSQAQAPGQSQSPGKTNAPGHGQGLSGQNGQNNTNNNAGKNEQVFVPGQVGSGTSNISVDGSTGTVQSGNQVPFSQVIAQYSQMAHDAIQNSNVPPDLKNLIQNYFNSLEGRQ